MMESLQFWLVMPTVHSASICPMLFNKPKRETFQVPLPIIFFNF